MFSLFRSRSQLQNRGRSLLITGRLRIPGLSEVISEKFCAYNLAGKVLKFLRKLIANRKFKLAIAIKSAKLGKKMSSFPLNEKCSGFSGLSGLSGLVPNYVYS